MRLGACADSAVFTVRASDFHGVVPLDVAPLACGLSGAVVEPAMAANTGWTTGCAVGGADESMLMREMETLAISSGPTLPPAALGATAADTDDEAADPLLISIIVPEVSYGDSARYVLPRACLRDPYLMS